MLEKLFGNQTVEKVLLYVANYGEGHTSGIAQTFDLPKSVKLYNGCLFKLLYDTVPLSTIVIF